MGAYWVRFENGQEMCVEGPDEAAVRVRAETFADPVRVQSVKRLPYPARPRLEPFESWEWQGRNVVTPEFCHSPRRCAGRTSCPQSYACSE
jgi:hypothetical protein